MFSKAKRLGRASSRLDEGARGRNDRSAARSGDTRVGVAVHARYRSTALLLSEPGCHGSRLQVAAGTKWNLVRPMISGEGGGD